MPYGFYDNAYNETGLATKGSEENKMTLNGRGTIRVKPDTALINLGIETINMNLETAQKENARISNNLINTLVGLGVPEKDMQTVNYIINPEYEFVENKRIFKGYRVIHNFRIRIRNIERVGEIIDAAVKEGANLAGNIEFIISNEEEYYKRALNFAIEDTIEKAENIERRFNYRINKIPLSIKEESFGQRILEEGVQIKAFSGTTPIQSGLIEITSVVTVVFSYQ